MTGGTIKVENTVFDRLFLQSSLLTGQESEDNSYKIALMKKAAVMSVEKLTDKQKDVVCMYFVLGLSVTQIANIQKVAKSTISRTLERANRKMAEYSDIPMQLIDNLRDNSN